MPRNEQAIFDVVVVGAGPAGCAAAISCGKLGARVVLIAAGTEELSAKRIAWLGPAGIELCRQCGVTVKSARATPFVGLRLHSWDLKRSVEVNDAELTGWLLERGPFGRALSQAARRAGAKMLAGAHSEALTLGEDCAVLRLADGPVVRARIVIIADGADSPTAKLAHLVAADSAQRAPEHLQLVFEATRGADGLDVVVGGGRGAHLVTIVRRGKHVRLTLLNRDPSQPSRDGFARFVAAAKTAGLVPADARGEPTARISPAGVALDMDSHVGKRCLLVGDAGGFVAAFSNEGIYPAMKSGWIAGQTAVRALKAPLVQDELASFSNAWRAELADYLRMPNTDLSLLMPLVFNNPQMSARVARAFLLGQKF